MRQGFTIVELLLAMGVFAILAGLGSVNYFSTYNQTSAGTLQEVLIADLRSAQAKAMTGQTSGGVAVPSWGVKFLSSSYVVFPGPSYVAGSSANYIVALPEGMVLTPDFASDQVLFAKGSGEIIGYDSEADSLTAVLGTTTKNIELNRLGVIVGD